jgi:hypothetical protein
VIEFHSFFQQIEKNLLPSGFACVATDFNPLGLDSDLAPVHKYPLFKGVKINFHAV